MTQRNLYIWFTTVIYMAGAALWIFLFDALLADFISPESPQSFATVKGIFFVAVTTVALIVALHSVPDRQHRRGINSFGGRLAQVLTYHSVPKELAYLCAFVLPSVALLLRSSIPVAWHDPMLELLMLPIILSAFLGGLGPGLVSTAVTGLLVAFLVDGAQDAAYSSWTTLLCVGFLVANGILISILGGSLKRSVLTLKQHQNLLDTVINETSDAVFLKDTQGRYLLANPVVGSFLGQPIEAIIGKTDAELFDAASAEVVRQKDLHVLDTKSVLTHEQRLRSHKGEDRTWAITKSPVWNHDGTVVGVFGLAHDITVLRDTLTAVQRSERRLTLTLEAISDGFWDWNLHTGEVFRSAGYMHVMGHAAASDTRDFDFFLRVLHPEDRVRVQATIAAHLAGDSCAIRFDTRILTDQGETRWIRARGRAIERDASGRAQRVLGTIQNITDTLRNTQDLQLVLNEAYEAIWIMDSSRGRFLYANPAACRLCGYPVGGLEQLRLSDVLPLEEKIQLPQHIRTLTHHKLLRREWKLLRQDKTLVQVDVLSERLQDGRIIAFGRDLTDEKKMLRTLREREQQLARVLDGSDQGFWEWHLPSNRFTTSERFAAILGYDETLARDASLDHWLELIHKEDLPPVWQAIHRHQAGLSAHIEVVSRMRRADGGWHWVLSRGRIVERATDGSPLMISGTHTDYNERKSLELLMQQSGVVFDHVQEAILITAPDGAIRKANAAFQRISGYTEAEVLGQNPRIMGSHQHPASFFEQLFAVVNDKGHWQGEVWNRHKNGHVYPCRMSISEIRDSRGEVQLYVGVLSDITKEKAYEAELHRMAHHDLLTGLPNRLLLGKELATALVQNQLENQYLAVCFLDLDGFKSVNDHYGHHVGDQLLIHTADRLRGVLRPSDVVARPGGDEFVLLLSGLDHPHEVHHLAEQILSVIQSAIHIEGHGLTVSASMGITLHPTDDADADTLLRHADQAMYIAKEMGKNRYVIFDPVHDKQLQTQRDLLQRLQQAYEAEEFVLFYQPKVDLSDGRVIGAEALIRWQHPERGLLPPAEFIHVLENSPLERLVGNWAIANALEQLSEWQRQGVRLQISVNIGAGHLLRADFVPDVQERLRLHDNIQPHQLEIEILETAGLWDMDKAIDTLKKCQSLGLSFALDDFGTGYSSLAYFRKLPVQMIKIDQSFVRNMLNDHNDFDIVESVVRLAQAFHRPVIAEGVETLAHGKYLLEMGCHLAQGYGIAKPMPAHAFLAWMEHWTTAAPWLQHKSG